MDYIKLFEKAEAQINNKINAGCVFGLTNLFDSADWNKLSQHEQKQFEKYFSDKISEGNIPDVRRISLAESGFFDENRGEDLMLFIRL